MRSGTKRTIQPYFSVKRMFVRKLTVLFAKTLSESPKVEDIIPIKNKIASQLSSIIWKFAKSSKRKRLSLTRLCRSLKAGLTLGADF